MKPERASLKLVDWRPGGGPERRFIDAVKENIKLVGAFCHNLKCKMKIETSILSSNKKIYEVSSFYQPDLDVKSTQKPACFRKELFYSTSLLEILHYLFESRETATIETQCLLLLMSTAVKATVTVTQ